MKLYPKIKYMKNILAVFALLIIIASCSSKNEPIDVVKGFVNALEQKDWNKMKGYVTKNYTSIVDDAKRSYGSMSTPKADEFTFILVKNKDGFAEVNIEEKKHKELSLKPYTIFYLTKENSKWCIYSI